jgi:L-iditol 2-dehydrogenase
VQFGVFAKNVNADWNIIGDTKEIAVYGSHLSGHCYHAVIKGMLNGTIKTDGVVSHTYPLEEWKKAFETAETDPNAIKVVLKP